MPGRNIIKQYGANQYYHIYSRGTAKQAIFLDDQDYAYFLSLFKRYLSASPETREHHAPYPHFTQRLDLLAYCLMSNHIHLLTYQNDEKAIIEFMRSLMTSYSMYFNKKYDRVGPVFQSRYRASIIDHDNYLQHISRYIHLNPKQWRNYQYSSLPYYLQSRAAEWIKPEAVMELFDNNTADYIAFLEDYKDHKQMLDELKWELAHS